MMNDLSTITREFGDLSRWSQPVEFWPLRPEEVACVEQKLPRAQRRVIGHTAGKREIIAFEYGAKEDIDATTDNLQSAVAYRSFPPDPTDIFPSHFFGTIQRKKPVIVVQGAIHGGELTGTGGAINLCSVIESGRDLRGRSWAKLHDLARNARVLIIPWLNRDGTERWPFATSGDIPLDLWNRCMFGVTGEGTCYAYPDVKSIQPIPPNSTSFMGAYFNDAGVNLQYDFCNVMRQPETIAWMQYYLDERPDCVLLCHCDAGSMVHPPPYFLPTGYQHQHSRIGAVIQNRLLREGYSLRRSSGVDLPNFGRPYMYQADAVYHVCGAQPIMCEFPGGVAEHPFTCDELLDICLLAFEELFAFAHQEGLRPYRSRRSP